MAACFRVRDLGGGLVRDDALRVGAVFGGRVEVQPADIPIEIQQVLELERNLLG